MEALIVLLFMGCLLWFCVWATLWVFRGFFPSSSSSSPYRDITSQAHRGFDRAKEDYLRQMRDLYRK
jgi:hypothetical protein